MNEPTRRLTNILDSQPVPVEPVRFMWRSHGMIRHEDGLFVSKVEYDSLQSALKLAQYEKKRYSREWDTALDVAGKYLKRAEKAEERNRRIVEKYRDLVVAAEDVRKDLEVASNGGGVDFYRSEKYLSEALAKLEEA